MFLFRHTRQPNEQNQSIESQNGFCFCYCALLVKMCARRENNDICNEIKPINLTNASFLYIFRYFCVCFSGFFFSFV